MHQGVRRAEMAAVYMTRRGGGWGNKQQPVVVENISSAFPVVSLKTEKLLKTIKHDCKKCVITDFSKITDTLFESFFAKSLM